MANITKKDELKSLRTMLDKSSENLRNVATEHLKVDRMVNLMVVAASKNPKILECTQVSVLEFCMKCSETGLEPIGAGGAWAIPYKATLQFIPDYRGLVNTAKRVGAIRDAWWEVVKENDQFDFELGLDPCLTHKPGRGDRGKLEFAYCVIVLPEGERRFVVMDREEIMNIKSRSKAASSGPWVTDEGEMWKKTVVRRAMKPFVGVSPALTVAIESDNAASGIELEPERRSVAMPKEKQANAEVIDNELDDADYMSLLDHTTQLYTKVETTLDAKTKADYQDFAKDFPDVEHGDLKFWSRALEQKLDAINKTK